MSNINSQTSSEDLFKHKEATFPHLNTNNYATWSKNCKHLFQESVSGPMMLLASAFSSNVTRRTVDIHEDPLTLEAALSGPNGNKWKEAVGSEYMSLLENGAFEAPKNKDISSQDNPLLPDPESENTKCPIKIPFDANLIGYRREVHGFLGLPTSDPEGHVGLLGPWPAGPGLS